MCKLNYDVLLKKYPVLFCQKDKPMSETCMCWGIEADIGWYEPLDKLCSKLEALNNDYKKYHVQIQATQVKQKYGGLRFYYNVFFEKTFMDKIILFPFQKIVDFLNKHFDFGVVCFNHENHISVKAKKHKILYKIKSFCQSVEYFKILKPSKKSVEKAKLLYDIASSLIEDCEDECWDTCERCGDKNNFDKTNIITTSGWISRICKKCAQKIYDNETTHYDKSNPDCKYHNIKRVTLFREGYQFLNFYNYKSFQYDGKYYSSLPHAYFSIKNPDFNTLYYELSKTGDKSSYLIEAVSNKFNCFYDEKDYGLIKTLVRAKFSDKELKQDLLDTGDKLLINMNKRCDNLLGTCFCEKCKFNEGKNIYGKILMEIREEFKNENQN